MQVEDLFTLAVNARTVDGHVMQSGDHVAIDGHGDHEVGYEAMCGHCYLGKIGWPDR